MSSSRLARAATALAFGLAANPLHARGRLTVEPTPPEVSAAAGHHALGLRASRDARVFVPASYRAARPTPLVVFLHGAGGDADQGLRVLQAHADTLGFIVLAPASADATWDLLRGGLGPDVAHVDAALAATFARWNIDRERLVLAGFSDGASYALSLGLANGDRIRAIVAFSPGFAAPPSSVGRPLVFLTHGTGDAVLPIDPCSRRIAPVLERAGYAVDYREFDGGHRVPAPLARDVLAQALSNSPGSAGG